MNADAAVPHVLASGGRVFLRAGDRVTIAAGRGTKLAEVVDPSARRGGVPAIRVRMHYRARGWAKGTKAIAGSAIVAQGWERRSRK